VQATGGASDGSGGSPASGGSEQTGAGGTAVGSGGKPFGSGGAIASGGFFGAGGIGAGGIDGSGGLGAGGIGAGGVQHASGGNAGAGGIDASGGFFGSGGLGAGGIGAGGIDGSGGLPSAGGSGGGGTDMHQLQCWNGSATAQFSKQCRETSDCIVATHWMGCCSVAAVGLNAAERARYESFESLCGGTPLCGCCCDRYSTEDGEVVLAGTTLAVECINGTCTSYAQL
jgi:hypothetical protein